MLGLSKVAKSFAASKAQKSRIDHATVNWTKAARIAYSVTNQSLGTSQVEYGPRITTHRSRSSVTNSATTRFQSNSRPSTALIVVTKYKQLTLTRPLQLLVIFLCQVRICAETVSTLERRGWKVARQNQIVAGGHLACVVTERSCWE